MCSEADAFFEAKKEEFLRESSGEAQDSPGEAFREALETYGPKATVLAMPFGGATLPSVAGEPKA